MIVRKMSEKFCTQREHETFTLNNLYIYLIYIYLIEEETNIRARLTIEFQASRISRYTASQFRSDIFRTMEYWI